MESINPKVSFNLSRSDYESKPRWFVELEDGSVVFQKEPECTWQSLKSFCKEENIKPSKLYIGFRDNVKFIGESNRFFFIKAAGAMWGGPTSEFYIAGPVIADKIYAQKWLVPEMIQRPFINDNMIDVRLIENYEHCIVG